MNEILNAPISSLLVIAGLICVVLAIIGSIRGKIIIDVPPEKQRLLGGVGIVFLLIGLALGTIIQPTLIDEGIKPTSTPPITSTPTPSPTPTPTYITVKMDTTSGWEIDKDDKGSLINIKSVPGRTGNAIEISYDLKEEGWVAIYKEINPEILSNKEGIQFFYKGSGEPNTIQLGLKYRDVDETIFGVSLDRKTVAEDWVSIEVPYTYFDCWWPDDNCLHYGNKLDLKNVRKIGFGIENYPGEGDVNGSGRLIIDDVQGFTS